MLGIGEDSPLQAGEYLALVRRENAGQLFKLRGVRQTDPIDLAPVGWHGWQGWRVHLDSGANVGPYVIEEESVMATWELELPPEPDVQWREMLPVHVGRWPRLIVSSPEAFTGAIVEVTCERAETNHHLAVGRPGGVPLSSEGDRCFLDLAAVGELNNRCYGTVHVSCRPPSQPAASPLTAHFIRLPPMKLSYVPDLARSEQVFAVRIKADPDVLAAVAPEADTELVRDSEGLMLCARVPYLSPGVSAKLARYEAVVRVRVPATRLALVTESRGFLGWCEPPFCDLDLSTVESRDRLRIELHEEPALEDGRLFCRLVGGEEMASGSSIASGGPLWQFEVELHLWRDRHLPGGTIQARTSRQWLDIVRLREQKAPPDAHCDHGPEREHDRDEPVTDRARLMGALEEVLSQEDHAEVRRVAGQCLEHVAEASVKPVDRELLLLAVSRAFTAGSADDLHQANGCLAELGDRPDLPEAEILRRTVALRLNAQSGGARRLSADDVERLGRGLPDLPQALLFRAECWYQFARHAQGSAVGGWQTCLDLASRCLTRVGMPLPERRPALVLRALARLMLALEPDSPPLALSSEAATDIWVAALCLAAQSVRTPRHRAEPPVLSRLEGSDIPVLCPEDAALVRITVAHGTGRPAAENDLAALSHWQAEQFFAINLLRARQARLQGNDLEARERYNQLFQDAIAHGPDFLLDVEANERQA
jgi:hypothetical protein